MTLSTQEFEQNWIGDDPYANIRASLRLVDIPLKSDVTPRLSIIMSVYHRFSQLQRTMETLCRQSFKDFEVLLFNNGDDQNLQEIVDQFSPYLHIKYMVKEEPGRYFDPSLAIKKMLPLCEGEVIAFMQPECMLWPEAVWWLYYGHFLSKEEMGTRIKCFPEGAQLDIGENRCVTLKTLFANDKLSASIDHIAWHTNMNAFFDYDGFWRAGGLAGFSNTTWRDYDRASWWFVHSYRNNSKLWENLPVFKGHAGIDFFTINYREVNNYVEIMPTVPLALHQEHHRMSWGPEVDKNYWTAEYIRKHCKE